MLLSYVIGRCYGPLHGSAVWREKSDAKVSQLFVQTDITYWDLKICSARRIITSSMTEDVRTLEEEIAAVSERVDDPVICEKIKRYVYAPKEIQAVYKADAGTSTLIASTETKYSSMLPDPLPDPAQSTKKSTCWQ